MAGTTREEFLKTVRQSLGRKEGAPEPEYLALRLRREDQRQKVVTIEARVEARRRDLLTRLERVAGQSGWRVYRAASPEAAAGYVLKLAREKAADLVVRSEHDVFRRVPIDGLLRQEGIAVTPILAARAGDREHLRQEMDKAQIGVTGVDYAVAETGTCVLLPRRGVSRAVSLLPPVHVALVEPHQVYETLDDLFAVRRLAFIQGRGDAGSYLSLTSGPSRTADIEQTLVIGVHGPVEAHLVLLPPAPEAASPRPGTPSP
ncbi:MAG: lactate utilization protein [Chloroflexi bacterium]|nr:lactate utilization protein [Chloroflexota bacterium]